MCGETSAILFVVAAHFFFDGRHLEVLTVKISWWRQLQICENSSQEISVNVMRGFSQIFWSVLKKVAWNKRRLLPEQPSQNKIICNAFSHFNANFVFSIVISSELFLCKFTNICIVLWYRHLTFAGSRATSIIVDLFSLL
jgi:hypothetical protein